MPDVTSPQRSGPERVVPRLILVKLPHLCEPSVRDVDDEDDVLVQHPVVALGVIVVQANRVVLAADDIVQAELERSARPSNELAEIIEHFCPTPLDTRQTSLSSHMPDRILGKHVHQRGEVPCRERLVRTTNLRHVLSYEHR